MIIKEMLENCWNSGVKQDNSSTFPAIDGNGCRAYALANQSKGVNDMLRAIHMGTTHRAITMQTHHAKRVERNQACSDQTGIQCTEEVQAMKNENTEREAYIEFITRMLTERADLRITKMVYEFVLHIID